MKNMQDRRSEVRMLCADMVAVCWKDEKGKRRRGTALLEDISPSGACLQFETPLAVGTDIRWESPRKQFLGRVQYCVYREIGYFVGVEFLSSSKWSKRMYRPQHLLDLERLMESARR